MMLLRVLPRCTPVALELGKVCSRSGDRRSATNGGSPNELEENGITPLSRSGLLPADLDENGGNGAGAVIAGDSRILGDRKLAVLSERSNWARCLSLPGLVASSRVCKLYMTSSIAFRSGDGVRGIALLVPLLFTPTPLLLLLLLLLLPWPLLSREKSADGDAEEAPSGFKGTE